MNDEARIRRLQIASIAALTVFVLALALVLLLQHGGRRTAVNNVSNGKYLLTLTAADPRVCVTQQSLPAGTGAVRVYEGTYGPLGAPLRATIADRAGKVVGAGTVAGYPNGKFLSIPLGGLGGRAVDDGTLCLTLMSKTGRVALAGMPNGSIDPGVATQGRKAVPGDVQIEYLAPGKPTVMSQIGKLLHRAVLFKPGWVGVWTFWVLAVLALAMIALAALALVRGPPRWSKRRWILLIVCVTFGNAFVWSVVTPAFQVPDEPAHYAYVDTLALRGIPGKKVGEGAPAYSNRVVLALDYTANGIVGVPQARPPWRQQVERGYFQRDAALGKHANDASGWSPAGPYTPIYYGPAVIPYFIAGGTPIDRDWAVRIYGALLVCLTALLAFLTARELMPRPDWFAPVAGLSVAFEPMLLHIGAGVENDGLLIVAASLFIYLIVVTFRRGLTPARAAAVGATFAFGYHTKPTMIGLAPALLVAAAWLLLRDDGRPRRDRLRAIATGGVALVAVWGVGYLLFGGTGSDTASTLVGGSHQRAFSITDLGSYSWQWFLPPLPFMGHWFDGAPPAFSTFFRGFLADFNHLDTYFPKWVYALMLLLAVALGAMLVRMAIANWKTRERWLPVASVLVIAPVGLALFVVLTSYLELIANGGNFAQGRYLLPCVTLFGIFIAMAAKSFGERWAPIIGTLLVLGVAFLNLFSYGLSLSRFYL